MIRSLPPPDPGPTPEPVTVYEPSPSGMPKLGPYIREVLDRRPLIWHLARTDLKAEHYETFLGQVWLILNPLLLASVYLLVRTIIKPVGSAADRNAIIDHLIMGVFFFQYSAAAINFGSRAIIGNKQLILNTSLPRTVFVIESTLKSVIDFIPTFFVYLAIHWALGQPFTNAMWLLPVLLALQTLFNFGMAMLFAALTVFVLDVQQVLRYFLRLWLFATPVLYTVAEIPPGIEKWLRLNPLFPFFAAYEQIGDGQWPSIGYVVTSVAWAVGITVIGTVFFLKRERIFAARF